MVKLCTPVDKFVTNFRDYLKKKILPALKNYYRKIVKLRASKIKLRSICYESQEIIVSKNQSARFGEKKDQKCFLYNNIQGR